MIKMTILLMSGVYGISVNDNFIEVSAYATSVGEFKVRQGTVLFVFVFVRTSFFSPPYFQMSRVLVC